MDFTINQYRKLLKSLIAQGYTFQPFAEFLEHPEPRSIILRHDVEAKYENALAFAQIQHDFQLKGTYYFRFLPNHFSTEIIEQIAALGHETGYHYDDLSHCNGDYDAAIKRFEKNLATLREIAPVKTICMEGAPLSKWDNRELWSKHQIPNSKLQTNYKNQIQNSRNPEPGTRNTMNYHDYGIIGEPYFDLDFTKVFYLTDTGRRWDGDKVSVRDKVGQLDSRQLDSNNSNFEFRISNFHPPAGGPISKLHSTRDIINAANAGALPDQIMFTFHPQRWTDKPLPWVKELVMQNVKNVVKWWMVR